MLFFFRFLFACFYNKKNWQSNITLFITAQTISLLGSSLVQFALVWYVTLSTASGKMLAISTVCAFVPQILISPLAGVFIDRYDRKKIIIGADIIIALSTLILVVAFKAGFHSIILLFMVLVLRAIGTGIQTPAVNSVIPQMIPQSFLMRVNGIQSTLSSLILFLSPALSGFILSVTTVEITLFVDVITALIGVCMTTMVLIPKRQIQRLSFKGVISDFKKGFDYVKTHSFVKRILFFQGTVLFLISPSAFLIPLFVSRLFGADIWRLAVAEMTYSFGSVLGGLFVVWIGAFRNRFLTILCAAAVYGFLMICIGITPFFIFFLILNGLIGIVSPYYNASLTVSIQEKVPTHMQGRIFSFMQISTTGALPLGMLIFGPIADIISIQALLIGCGLSVLFCTAIMYRIYHKTC